MGTVLSLNGPEATTLDFENTAKKIIFVGFIFSFLNNENPCTFWGWKGEGEAWDLGACVATAAVLHDVPVSFTASDFHSCILCGTTSHENLFPPLCDGGLSEFCLISPVLNDGVQSWQPCRALQLALQTAPKLHNGSCWRPQTGQICTDHVATRGSALHALHPAYGAPDMRGVGTGNASLMPLRSAIRIQQPGSHQAWPPCRCGSGLPGYIQDHQRCQVQTHHFHSFATTCTFVFTLCALSSQQENCRNSIGIFSKVDIKVPMLSFTRLHASL